ncbi:hypothetical protein THRCLA_22159, partial [Thraustotheca clavata]
MAKPFVAYTTEPFPWIQEVLNHELEANFTSFNASLILTAQCWYNNDTLPSGLPFYTDRVHNSFVVRRVVDPAKFTICSSFLQVLPAEQGTCIIVRFLALSIAHQILWISRNDQIDNGNSSQTFTLTFVLTQYRFVSLIWLKFFVRCSIFAIVAICLWKVYYRHYFDLANTIACYGHQQDLVSWRYHLVVGDPMAILVTNKYIIGA